MVHYYILALHIIFVVTWFAGLFYIVRLFIYHAEAEKKEEPEKTILQNQYKIMEKRLWYIITWPSMIITVCLGTWLMIETGYFREGWMHVKLVFVMLLVLYHLACHKIYLQLQNDEVKYSSTKLRMWNEVSTLLLFAIVFLVELKDKGLFDWVYGVVGLILLAGIMMIAIKLYKKKREQE
ncbi:MAG: CopD family protein [Flavobacteriales bacterium]